MEKEPHRQKYVQHGPTPRILYKMCLNPGPITKSKSCPKKWRLYKITTQPQDAGQHHFTTKSGPTANMLLNPQKKLYKKSVYTGGRRLQFCRGNWWDDLNNMFSLELLRHGLLPRMRPMCSFPYVRKHKIAPPTHNAK